MSERVELWAAFLRVLALAVLLVGVGLRSVSDTYAPFSDTATVSGSVTAAASFVPIAASLDIDPDVLRPGSQGQFVTAYIELPAGFDVANIDVSTVDLRAEGEAGRVPDLPHPTKVGDHDHDGIADLMVKFARQEVLALLKGRSGAVTIVVSGQLSGGQVFQGSDIIHLLHVAKDAPGTAATATPTPTATPTAVPTATATPTLTLEP